MLAQATADPPRFTVFRSLPALWQVAIDVPEDAKWRCVGVCLYGALSVLRRRRAVLPSDFGSDVLDG
jgi:hypothetical protein